MHTNRKCENIEWNLVSVELLLLFEVCTNKQVVAFIIPHSKFTHTYWCDETLNKRIHWIETARMAEIYSSLLYLNNSIKLYVLLKCLVINGNTIISKCSPMLTKFYFAQFSFRIFLSLFICRQKILEINRSQRGNKNYINNKKQFYGIISNYMIFIRKYGFLCVLSKLYALFSTSNQAKKKVFHFVQAEMKKNDTYKELRVFC